MKKKISSRQRSGKSREMWELLTETLKEQVVSGQAVRFEPVGFKDEEGRFHLQSVGVFFIEEAKTETESKQ